MKIIVTGGAGFIGSNLVHSFSSEDEVVVIDNLSSGYLKNLSDLPCKFIEADIGKADDWMKEFRSAEEVYHLAAMADIVPSIECPTDYHSANVTGTVNVMEAIRNYSPKASFVYTASSSCYGKAKNFPTSELDNVAPEYPYALTKFLGEEIVLHWSKVYGVKANSCRLFNVYGNYSRNSGSYGAMFGVFLGQILNDLPLTIVGDGSQTRDFTHVSDVVSALTMVCRSSSSGEIFNVGSGTPVSVLKIAELLNHNKHKFIPKRPGEPEITHADIKKISSYTGWKPEISIETGVKSLKNNIHLFAEMPAWTEEKIANATKSWFKYLK